MGTRSIRKRIPKEACLEKRVHLVDQLRVNIFMNTLLLFINNGMGGVGEELAKFLCGFLREFSSKMDTGFLTAKIVAFFMKKKKNPYDKLLQHLTTLDKMFKYDHQIAYIVTTRQFFDYKSIMLSFYGGNILTARPEKFLKTFQEFSEGTLQKIYY
jgi:hypothetical protein